MRKVGNLRSEECEIVDREMDKNLRLPQQRNFSAQQAVETIRPKCPRVRYCIVLYNVRLDVVCFDHNGNFGRAARQRSQTISAAECVDVVGVNKCGRMVVDKTDNITA